MNYIKKGIILLILLIIEFESALFAQTISGRVVDSKTDQPISYVNVGIVGKNMGTVSGLDGDFKFSISGASDKDTLRFSMISYVTKDFLISDIRKSGISESIKMNEKTIQLQEVIVTNQNASVIVLGVERKNCYPIPLYKGASSNLAFPQNDYRHEIGTRFTNVSPLILDSIQLNLAEANLDRLEFRINVYLIENEIMSNILTKPIYISLNKEEAENFPTIDLTMYQIKVNSDFLITIENYKKMAGGSLKILANFKSKGELYPTYYRNNSQSHWTKLQTSKSKDIGMSLLVFGQSYR